MTMRGALSRTIAAMYLYLHTVPQKVLNTNMNTILVLGFRGVSNKGTGEIDTFYSIQLQSVAMPKNGDLS